MPVTTIETREQIDSLRQEWDLLSDGNPFHSWAWLIGWWQAYQHQTPGRLWVLAVRDEQEKLLGIAPWMVCQSTKSGRVIRPLGGGEVCTDHLSVLAKPENTQQVATELAGFLARQAVSSSNGTRWDAIELSAIDEAPGKVKEEAQEKTVENEAHKQTNAHHESGESHKNGTLVWELVRLLSEQHGLSARRQPAHNVWRVALPKTWEEYVSLQSKSHRKQLRRFERRILETERAKLHLATNPEEFEIAWNVLVELHQRRRKSLGESGCFASESFTRFHRQVAENFLEAGRLRLYWLALDGEPIAAEYQFAGRTHPADPTIYAYQSGVDPDRLEEEPGRLIMIATIQAAIAEGRTTFDFLRGDEPYKAHWRANPQPAYNVRVVPHHASARVRDGVQLALGEAKSWVKNSLGVLSSGTS